MLSSIDRKLTAEDNDSLCAVPTYSEVKEVVMNLKPESSPGLDGFTGLFYQKMWHIVGEDLTAAAADFFRGVHLPRPYTCMSLKLIPKKQIPPVLRT